MKPRTLPVGVVMDEFEGEEPTKPEETTETTREIIARLRTETDRQRPTVRDMVPLERPRDH